MTMRILRFVLNTVGVLIAALVGNWVGGRWRAMDTGEAEHEIALVQKSEDGVVTFVVNPVMTNFLPAVLIGFVSKPAGWVMASVSGVMAARFLGDQYEGRLKEILSRQSTQISETQ